MADDLDTDRKCELLNTMKLNPLGFHHKLLSLFQEQNQLSRIFKLARDADSFGAYLNGRFCSTMLDAAFMQDNRSILKDIKNKDILQLATRNLIQHYTSICDLQSAETAFRDLRSRCNIIPNLKTYTSMMNAYRKLANLEQVVSCHEALLEDEITPDIAICNILVRAHVAKGHIDDAMQIMAEFEEIYGIKMNIKTLTSFLTGACRNFKCDMKLSLKTFDRIRSLGDKPDISVYNTMIGGYGRRKMFNEMKTWCSKLKEAGLNPDKYTFSIVSNALLYGTTGTDSKSPNLPLEVWFEEYFGQPLRPKSEQSGSLASVYSDHVSLKHFLKGNSSDGFLSVLDRLRAQNQTGPKTYHALITKSVKDGDLKNALDIFNKMCERNIKPNAAILSELIKLSIKAKNSWMHTLKLFKYSLRTEIYPSDEVYRNLVIASARATRKWPYPRKNKEPVGMSLIIDSICNLKAPLSSGAYHGMLYGLTHPDFLNNLNTRSSIQILDSMFKWSIYPSRTAFNCVLSATSWDPSDQSFMQITNLLLRQQNQQLMQPYTKLLLENFLSHNHSIRIPLFYQSVGDRSSLMFRIIAQYIKQLAKEGNSELILQMSQKLLDCPVVIDPELCSLILEHLGIVCKDYIRARTFWQTLQNGAKPSVPRITEQIAWTWTRCLVWWGHHHEAVEFATQGSEMLGISTHKILIPGLVSWLKEQNLTTEVEMVTSFWRRRGTYV
jgi:pentatricopeptide repeat protein